MHTIDDFIYGNRHSMSFAGSDFDSVVGKRMAADGCYSNADGNDDLIFISADGAISTSTPRPRNPRPQSESMVRGQVVIGSPNDYPVSPVQQLAPIGNYLVNTSFWSNRIGGTTNPNHGHMVPAGDKIKGYLTVMQQQLSDAAMQQMTSNPNYVTPREWAIKVTEHSAAPNARISAPYVDIIVPLRYLTKV